jgi:hypothetical protein
VLVPEAPDVEPPPQEVRVIVMLASSNMASAGAHRNRPEVRSDADAARKNTNAKTVVRRMRDIFCWGFTPAKGDTNPCDDVATATLTFFAAVPLKDTELGVTEQVDIAGPPLQLNATFCANPLVGARATE